MNETHAESLSKKGAKMQLGMIGLGRMGASMVSRLLQGGHECVVFDMKPDSVKGLANKGATGAASLEDFMGKLKPPRAVWLMVPAAAVEVTVQDLAAQMQQGDIVIDGGNSYYVDDIRRANELRAKGIRYVDVGTSGGVWGIERGYCLMIGGEGDAVLHLDPIFRREKVRGTVEEGYLHCEPSGAGHFVKMVHNRIEYGLMAAYSEGLNILRHANVGKNSRTADAETTPLHMPAPAAYPSGLIAACQHDDWAPAPDKRWNTEGLPCEPYSIG